METIMLEDALVGIEWEPQLTLLDHPNLIVSIVYKSILDYWDYSPYSQVLSVKGYSDILVMRCKLHDNPKESVFIAIDPEYIPSYYGKGKYPYLTIDGPMSNIEIGTSPVKLDMLNDQIEFCTNYLTHFVEDLALYSKGAAAFLPVSETKTGRSSNPNKHVNLSFPNKIGFIGEFNEYIKGLWKWCYSGLSSMGYYQLDSFRTNITTKKSTINKDGMRLHIMVPYNFTDYHTLARHAYKIWTEKREDNLRELLIGLFCYLDHWYLMNEQKDPILICHAKDKKSKIVNNLF